MKKKIVITGGTGRFGLHLFNLKTKHKLYFPKKSELNILKTATISNYLKKIKPNILIHLAGLSRPMKEHDENITKSIKLNIIGTANIVNICSELDIKLIYFSTNYVYPGKTGNYKETSPIFPVNKYAWSKLGGEAAVQLYDNSLILRVCMTEKPFVHKKAFSNIKTSFMYHDEVASILFKILDKKGIINIGGKSRYIYDFAKLQNPNIKKSFLVKSKKNLIPADSSMNIQKLKKILSNK